MTGVINYSKLGISYSPKIEAYILQKKSGKMTSDKAKIVNLLLDGPKTLEHFVLNGFKIQTCSARLSDLEDEGIVFKKADNHGGFSWYYLENDISKQELNRKAKMLDKKLAWLKRGLEINAISQEEHDELAVKFV